MHVHLPSHNVLRLTHLFCKLFLVHGVTTLRETGDVDGTATGAFRALEGQGRILPRLAGSFYFVGRPPFRWKNSLEYTGSHDARRIVERVVASGARCIKLYENLGRDDIEQLQREAERAGLQVIGHVPTPLSIEAAGLREPQHFFGVVEPTDLRRDHVFDRGACWNSVNQQRIDAVVEASVRLGLHHTPTLVTSAGILRYRQPATAFEPFRDLLPSFFGEVIWHPENGLSAYRDLQPAQLDQLARALEKKMTLASALCEAGCPVYAGTDTLQPFSVPGDALLRELSLLVDAGIPTAKVLQIATSDAARRLGDANSGKVSVDMEADLLILDRNPSDDVSAFRCLRYVIVRGRIVDVATMKREIEDELGKRNSYFAAWASRVLAQLAMNRAARNFTG